MALAIQILDGVPFRPGDNTPMSVSLAKFEQKGRLYSNFLCFISSAFIIAVGYSKPTCQVDSLVIDHSC